MTDLPDIGLRLHGGMEPAKCVELAKAAEANGFASVWFAENPFERGVLPMATACALATQRIQIGIGVWNPVHPPSEPDRHGDRHARRIGERPGAARHRLGPRGCDPEAQGGQQEAARRAARHVSHRARAVAWRGGHLRRRGVLGQGRQARLHAAATGHADLHGGARRQGARAVRRDRRWIDRLEHVPARFHRARGRDRAPGRGGGGPHVTPAGRAVRAVPCPP